MKDGRGSISLQVFNWKGQRSQSVFLTFALLSGKKTTRFLGAEMGRVGVRRKTPSSVVFPPGQPLCLHLKSQSNYTTLYRRSPGLNLIPNSPFSLSNEVPSMTSLSSWFSQSSERVVILVPPRKSGQLSCRSKGQT